MRESFLSPPQFGLPFVCELYIDLCRICHYSQVLNCAGSQLVVSVCQHTLVG